MNDILLELLNGSSITPSLLLMGVLTHYLSRQSRERNLRWFDWYRLPADMDLILAMFICDFGWFARSAITWGWRFFGMGDFNAAQVAGLTGGGVIVALGLLCKIRALTRPDYGDGPWLVSMGMTIAVTGLLAILTAIF